MGTKIKLFNQKDTKHKRRQLRKRMTKAEKIVWNMVRKKQLGYLFRRQYAIGRFIVDFYCPELKIIVEIDGGIHGEGDTPKHDANRERFFKQFNLDFYIKRYQNEQVTNYTESVYNDLKSYCSYVASPKPSPNPSLVGRGSNQLHSQ